MDTTDTGGVLVFPVGRYVGAFPGAGGRTHEVRLGAEIAELDEMRFALWARAHDPAAARGRRALITAIGHPDATTAFVSLLGDGLLAEVRPAESTAAGFAGRHRLVPLMLGLGNSAEEPGRYAIGFFGLTAIEVSRSLQDLWAWAHVDGDLWSAARAFAELERATGATDPAEIDPARVLAGFLAHAHSLLAAGAAHFAPVAFTVGRP